MLQRIIKSTVLLAFVLVMKAGAQGFPSPVDIESTIRIVQPITIEKVAGKDLHFGKFAAYAGSEGTITLSPLGVRTADGGIELLPEGPGSAAQFSVSGLEGAVFDLDLPTSTTIQNNLNQNNLMVISDFTTDLAEPFAIGPGGITTFNLGAKLTKDIGDSRGFYSGTFTVTVFYL